MGERIAKWLALGAAALLAGACANTEPKAGDVTEARLLAAEDDPDNWLGHGRTYAEQRFSPLTDINDGNVSELSLAWAVELDTNRGQEATPPGAGELTTSERVRLKIDYTEPPRLGHPFKIAGGWRYDRTTKGGAYSFEAQDERENLHWLEPIGINNTYAIALRREDAEEMGVTKISELEPFAEDLHLAGSQEFIVRIDGLPGMEEAYGFEFGQSNGMESGLMYTALENGDVDVISAFSTDGRIPALDFVLLEDDLAFFPPYHASPVVRGELLEEVPEAEEVLNQMGGLLDNTIMAELNFRVDDGGEEPRDVARDFLTQEGLLEGDDE